MLFTVSRTLAPDLVVLDEAGSTNTELGARFKAGRAKAGGPAGVVVTMHQTAGRGRLGRTWSAPAGTSLAVSVLLGPSDEIGLQPLLAGLAMTRAVRSLVPDPEAVLLKWPNDVLIAGRKVAGLLGEVMDDGRSVVMGAGLNLTMTLAQLPVPGATSLVLEGADPDDLADRALAAYLRELGRALAEPDPVAAISAVCGTLGREVRVELPDGSVVTGRADHLEADGRLVLDGVPGSLSAGDVTHVR